MVDGKFSHGTRAEPRGRALTLPVAFPSGEASKAFSADISATVHTFSCEAISNVSIALRTCAVDGKGSERKRNANT